MPRYWKILIASRTVERPTPNIWASSVSVGIRSCGFNWPGGDQVLDLIHHLFDDRLLLDLADYHHWTNPFYE